MHQSICCTHARPCALPCETIQSTSRAALSWERKRGTAQEAINQALPAQVNNYWTLHPLPNPINSANTLISGEEEAKRERDEGEGGGGETNSLAVDI